MCGLQHKKQPNAILKEEEKEMEVSYGAKNRIGEVLMAFKLSIHHAVAT